jgi:hypothetical protein
MSFKTLSPGVPYIVSANSTSRLALFLFLTYSLEVVLHFSKLNHHFHWICLACSFLNLRVLVIVSWLVGHLHPRSYFNSHENIVLLGVLVRKPFQVQRNELLAFSSPIVNFPCVSLFLSANACNFFTASLCKTEMPNLTFAFVYSCPG